MAGYSADGSSPSLDYLCAVVKVSILLAATDPDTDNIRLVTFSGKAGEQVSGNFGINYQQATLSATSSDDADKEVSVSLNQSLDAATPLDVFLVVPARTYASGFTITIQDAQGHTMTKGISKETELTPGKLYNTPSFRFVPSGMATGIEISSAEELIAFATGYNDKSISKNTQPGGVLVATVTQNISFDATTSAAFNATGGIGTASLNGDTNYFNGIFNGNGKTISGLQATVPLFAYTGSGGTVKDLTVDNTCSFVFTHTNTENMELGAVVGYHKGNLQNITVNADVSLAAVSNVAHLTSLGGLVGRATTGTLQGCTFGGLISTPSEFSTASDNKLIIGGLIGRFSNTGSVSGSHFTGAISNEAQVPVSANTTDPKLIIGGIVGHNDNGGSITSCDTSSDHADVGGAGSYSYEFGSIVNKTTIARHTAVGGIVGENNEGTVTSCTNGAIIFITHFRDSDADGRYMRTGGIVGKNNVDGTITGCVNDAKVSHRSNPRLPSMGGIVGWNAGTVSNCTNNGIVAINTCGQSIKSSRLPKLGGIIGENSSSNISNVHNTGNLEISRAEDGANVDVSLGGVIGYNTAAINGISPDNITNSGKVYWNTFNTTDVTTTGYNIGGVVGYSTKSIQNVKNTGYVLFNWNTGDQTAYPAKKVHLGGVVGNMAGNGTLSYCVNENAGTENSGNVLLQVVKVSTHADDYIGGILGYTSSNVSIENCDNSGYVATNNNITITDTNWYLGGIVGYLAGNSSIVHCDNTGYTLINAGNNTDNDVAKILADGGIAGVVKGTSSNPITISDCSWTYSTNDVGSRRGTCGGIAAYAEYANISDCDVTVNYNKYNHVTGGIVGWSVNSKLTNCKFHGTKITASQGYWSGGIVAKLDTGSIVDGCYNYCTDITAPKAPTVIGEIAAVSVVGTTIKNCHHTGTIGICSDTNFTDGGGNAADL